MIADKSSDLIKRYNRQCDEETMRPLNDSTLINAIWELTKKQYPEWDAPLTPKEGVVDLERNEKIDYSENGKK
jgi:hypothetical protein